MREIFTSDLLKKLSEECASLNVPAIDELKILKIFFASAGIEMLLGTFIKNVHGAIMTGVGITVVTTYFWCDDTLLVTSVGASIFR